MKIQSINQYLWRAACFILMIGWSITTKAQDSTVIEEAPVPVKVKPVKNTFNSIWIIDNQTVMVPVKKTLEFDIQHRFGSVENGYDDFWGLFAPSNIRIGFSYSLLNKLNIGLGITKSNMLVDGSAKYAILQQTKGMYPVSVTYYGNASVNTTEDEDNLFKYNSYRWTFFNQLIIARKFNDKLSLQIAPSVSHQNYVNGYYKQVDSAAKVVDNEMEHNHFAIAFSGRYRLTDVTSFIFNYDQPLTKHVTSNPAPNFSFGFEFTTSNHAFQLFMGNYSYLSPQRNNLFNQNSPGIDFNGGLHSTRAKYLIGFNMTRLWNY
jgi:hypothetical protein